MKKYEPCVAIDELSKNLNATNELSHFSHIPLISLPKDRIEDILQNIVE